MEQFIHQIILRTFAPSSIVEGRNFVFGRRRRGDVSALELAGPRAGFDVCVVDPVTLDIQGQSERISSTLIRRLLGAGNLEDANRCLGREFALCGSIVPGQRRGRMLEYPTANIDPGDQVVPGDGVYAARAMVRGKKFISAVSIGENPTFSNGRRSVEAFLLNAEGEFYDELMVLSFVRRLRDQERFSDVEALKAQIARDVKLVRNIFK